MKYHTIGIHSQDEGLDQILKHIEALERGEKVKPLRGEYYETIGLLLKNIVEKRLSLKVVSSKLDDRGHRELGQLVMKAFDAWNLTNEQRCGLLGVSLRNRSTLNGYSGKRPLPSKPGIISRSLNIAVIYDFLHRSDLKRPGRVDEWPTTPSAALDSKRPVDVMLQSMAGLARVRRMVETLNSCGI